MGGGREDSKEVELIDLNDLIFMNYDFFPPQYHYR